MAKDRITPCLYYVCAGECKKGRDAEHNGYCQKCNKYYPRVKERHLNKKKVAIQKDRGKYDYWLVYRKKIAIKKETFFW